MPNLWLTGSESKLAAYLYRLLCMYFLESQALGESLGVSFTIHYQPPHDVRLLLVGADYGFPEHVGDGNTTLRTSQPTPEGEVRA